jgi:DNA-binding CsgD family transcriptional regulator
MVRAVVTRLSRSDLESAARFVSAAADAAIHAEGADQWLVDNIAGLIPSELIVYSQVDAHKTSWIGAVWPEPSWQPSEDDWRLSVSTENPFCLYADRTGDRFFAARRLSEIVNKAGFRRTEYGEVFGERHEMQTRLPGGQTLWTLSFERSGRNYSRRDTTLLDFLRPALLTFESSRAILTRLAALEASPAFQDDVLTARESEILNLVADGASNTDIAHRLSISVGTVRKHLEHVYEKLGAASRTEALSRTGRTVSAISH